MTHPMQLTRCHEAVQLLTEHGFDGLAHAFGHNNDSSFSMTPFSPS